MAQPEDRPEFQLGLTMSGAISAGAYTAGVFDFLIEALDQWELAREGKIPGVDPAKIPNHFVGLKVISGASAGAITAAVGAVALADQNQQPVYFDPETKLRTKYYLPKLYETWVVKPTLDAGDPKLPDFLTSTDIDGTPFSDDDDYSATSGIAKAAQWPASAVSLLNARLLDGIAKSALDVGAVRPPRAFVSARLHIYLTLTNLRGVPYQVLFEGGDYQMLSHGDRVHYAVTGLGGWQTSSRFSDGDLGRDIDAQSLADGRPNKQWKDFTICALASAAFPVGLAPRQIHALSKEYDGADAGAFRRFPDDALAECRQIEPAWSAGLVDFPFMTADGGTIDNDPFEYARFALKPDDLSARIDFCLKTVDRAVIMISPFPPNKPPLAAGKPTADVFSIAAALVPSLVDQARFKPSELALAANPDHGSRYLIAPRRVEADDTVDRYPIASGLLGGFGGFVALSFRDHDFQLGRRNCQQFLKGTFAVPAANERIACWPEGVKENFAAAETKEEKAGEKERNYRLLPLFGTAAKTVELPCWPSMSRRDFDALQKRIAGRFGAIAPVLLQNNVKGVLGWLLSLALLPGVGGIRKRALDFIEAAILTDLVRRNQIEGVGDLSDVPYLAPDDLREVLARLINSERKPRNAQEIAESLATLQANGPDERKIERALDALSARTGKPNLVWRAPWTGVGGKKLYAFADWKPGLWGGAILFCCSVLDRWRRDETGRPEI
ncbi:patatin-like phospholipase family protein [Methylocella silvestris]|nr:patatin-like phospholipase family protein [Methylocella silvestris]